LTKWEYHLHRIQVHKIIKTYGRHTPLEKKKAASLAKKYQRTFKQRILDKWNVQGIRNVPAIQPIENIINPLRVGKKHHILNRWYKDQQKALKPIENTYDINNKMRNPKLSTSNDASNDAPLNLVIIKENTRQLYKFEVTSEKSLMNILSSKINF